MTKQEFARVWLVQSLAHLSECTDETCEFYGQLQRMLNAAAITKEQQSKWTLQAMAEVAEYFHGKGGGTHPWERGAHK